MRKTIYILFAMLLLSGLFAMAQIKPIKKPNAKPKTEKSRQLNNNKTRNSEKSNKDSSHKKSRTPIDMTSAQIERIIQQAIDDMVYVEGGTFLMGAPKEQDPYDFYIQHQVSLSSFYISKYEVTQQLWFAVMGNSIKQQCEKYFKDYRLEGEGAKYPMYCLSWDDCQEFIKKLNLLTGKSFRLPTEAEWEYSSRGGNLSKNYMFSGSYELREVAWFYDNSNGTTHVVGKKSPNELGLYDMSGNVDEWCQDWKSNYKKASQTNPSVQSPEPSFDKRRVLRGGGCKSVEHSCRVYYRDYSEPEKGYMCNGMRLAMSTL